jgi:type VI secretion system protein ImpA
VSEVLMPSEEVLDFNRLLAPIPGDVPAGIDLRSDSSPTSLYYAIKDARNAARAAERQVLMGGEENSSPPPDWRPVLEHGTKAIAGQSKDLEVVAYLIEAIVRKHGFAGLRDGFRLTRELVEQFWDGLYPLPDEEGLETRLAPLTGLNGDDAEGTLIGPITLVPLTQGESMGPFAYCHYQQATALGQVQDEAAREARVQQGAVSMPMFEKAVAETPAAFFVQLVDELKQCQQEFGRLGQVLDEKCGSKAPPTSSIRTALTACLDTITSLARDKLAAATPLEEPAAAADAQAPAAADGQVGGAGAIRAREDAFRLLLQVAEFFRRTEPHTPVSYALEQAVRWGRMSLPELLKELIPDDSPRLQFFTRVGIRPPEQREEDS